MHDIIIHTTQYIYRPRWVIHLGIKYMCSDYLLVGWQDDDLPIFGRVQSIIVVKGNAMFLVGVYNTLGIERHYHSFVINKTANVATCWLSELADYQPLQAHLLTNGRVYITFRAHIENIA